MKTLSQLAVIGIAFSLLSCTNPGTTYCAPDGTSLTLKDNGEAEKRGGPSLVLYMDHVYYGTWSYVSEGTAEVIFTKYSSVFFGEPEGRLEHGFSQTYHLDHSARTCRRVENSRGAAETDRSEN